MEEVNSYDNLLFENLNQINYTIAFIKETQRMWPVVGVATPRYAKKEVKIGEFTIPKGTTIFINLCVLHNTGNFINPDSFTPERWLE